MDLLEEQKKLQRSSYLLLEERIEKLQKAQTKEFAQAQGMLAYVQELILEIERFKEKYLQEVLGKVIRVNESFCCETLGVDYKNIDDAIAEPLASMLLENKISDEAFSLLQNSKQKFKDFNSEELRKKVKELIEYFQKRLALEGDFYASLGQGNGKSIFKDSPQRIVLAIWQISSNDLAVMLMGHLLSLKNIDNADADNTGNTRQSFGADIGATAHQRVAWRFLRDIEGLKNEELKDTYRDYESNFFESIEQLSCALWSNELELEVGQKMIDLAQEAKIVAEYTKVNDDKGFNYLKLEKTFLEKMNDTDKRLTYAASMTYKPMIIEPLDWKGLHGGGFLPDEGEENRFDLSLIKAASKKDREALLNKEIPPSVLDAINQMQKTAFCVNEQMLEVLLDYHEDINYLKKQNRVDFAYYRILREVLSSSIYEASKDEVYRHFSKTKFIQLTREKRLNSTDKKRIDKAVKSIEKQSNIEKFKLDANIYYEIAKYKQGFDSIVNIAKEMKSYEKFYFVWRMDFRGRLYPQQTLLNPQSGDLPKSLLLFSEQKPLNKDGLDWFFIHAANCYGEVDKEPFEERVAWVKEKHEQILASARDYKKESFWKKAGDPLKFLAWCFEYARYVESPSEFKTGIPIAIDGSNNGFQHITALLKDSDGAKSVNVLPYFENGALKVADFYAEVAEALKVLMQKEYDDFFNEKDTLEEKDGLYYEIKLKSKIEISFYFDKVSKFLKTVEPRSLNAMQFYSTYTMQNKTKLELEFTKDEFELLEKGLLKLERKMRKEVGSDDLKELKFSMIDELEKLAKRANRELEAGKIKEKKKKIIRYENQYKLDARSLYKRLLEENIVNRSFVKKPVMTESYGSSTAGKAKKILEDLEGIGVLSKLDEDSRYNVAFQLTKVLEKALTSVSDSPQKYKKWMKSYAKDIGKTNSAIKWKTPLNLEIEQVEFKAKKVKVSIGKGRKVEFKVYSDDIDTNSHSKGLSPNYIHSLDATHLMMTINGLKQVGINDVITVHDSFATHANDVGKMSKVLRKAFVALHKKEILEELTEFFYESFEVEKKDIPYVDEEGFNLEDIMESEYFFA